MMNKITLISLISALSCGSLAHAGGMGGDITNSGFLAIEGGYAINSIKNYEFAFIGANTAITSVKSNQNYVGRIGAGMLFMMDEQIGITSELGWGYYGKTTLKPATGLDVSMNSKYTITGFDALIGIAYIQPSFSLSLKAGALIQNMQIQTDAIFSDPFANANLVNVNIKRDQTGALPEIKVGASYNFDNNWSITGAYMYVAGSSPRVTGTFNVNTFNASLYSNTQNTTLNVGLLGIQYTC